MNFTSNPPVNLRAPIARLARLASKRVWLFYAWLIAFGALLPCSAADAPPEALTLTQAQELAVKNHPRITSAELIALASREVVRETRSSFFPRVNVDATAVYASAANTRVAAGGLNNPLILSREADGVSISQLITDFGRTANLTASSKLNAQAQEQNALATRAEILLAVNSAYFSALQAQAVVGVATQTVATRQLIFDQVTELAKDQIKSGLDVSFARVDLATGNLLVANANNDFRAALASLANLLGERDERDYRLADATVSTFTAVPQASQLIPIALQNRPDLAQLRYGLDAARRFARAEKDLNYPTVSAVGVAGVLPVHDVLMRDDYAAAGVNISIPIFDGLLFSAREKEASLRAKAAEQNLRDAENNVIRDVRIARLNLSLAAERLTLTAQLLAAAKEGFELAQAKYKAGSSSIVELSQSQLSLTEAEIAEARARYDYQTRASILNFQLGKQP